MPDRICALFCVPPISFARLGGSTTPLAAYIWARPKNPRTIGETVAVPSWSLNVFPDGSAEPFRPDSIRFRDGALIRPVCPFVEVWARVGDPDSDAASWRDAPLTPALLAAEGLAPADLTFEVTARNLKAARRTQRPELAYGTFPPVVVAGDDHSVRPLAGTSPPSPAPMIPAGREIPLGSVQVIRASTQSAPPDAPWREDVSLETVRIRFTPAAGHFYGPPQASAATNADPAPAVEPSRAFLNAAAGWFGSQGQGGGFVIPGDTFDETARRSGTSLGVVDDTCEARIDVALARPGGRTLGAHANLLVGPPDFAPDRRPFLSVADELNDRDAQAEARNAAMAGPELDLWVADLFERIYECVAQLNVDFWRDQNGMNVPPAGLAATPIPGDGLPRPTWSMGSRDALRNRTLRVAEAADDLPLPLAAHARERHRSLSDVEALRAFVLANPARLAQLIRAPFEAEPNEGLRSTSMRMPPFMAQSTFLTPLTLAAWQYDLLFKWVDQLLAAPTAPAVPVVERVALEGVIAPARPAPASVEPAPVAAEPARPEAGPAPPEAGPAPAEAEAAEEAAAAPLSEEAVRARDAILARLDAAGVYR
ncbi:MAG TPA: hypothetical protein VGX37_08695 [Allosphingosinicella sp.]|nr:hypothetical protein [Allosphingosinicella sp.]